MKSMGYLSVNITTIIVIIIITIFSYLSEASRLSTTISCSPLLVKPTRNSVICPAGSSRTSQSSKIKF